MASFLHTLVFFVITLAVLIAFHEFGHFWVARWIGVKVIRFSIGFGKPLWRYQKNSAETEYVIGAVPLGGYVKMVDEREDDVASEDLPYAFNRQSLKARTAIVLAGPLFNLLLAVVIFWGLLVQGERALRPLLGEIRAGTIAEQAGFSRGEEILEVDGRKTPTWGLAMSFIFSRAVDPNDIPVRVRTADGVLRDRVLEISEEDAMNSSHLQSRIGFDPWEPELPPRIKEVRKNGSAAEAGLEAGDLVVMADGVDVAGWNQWVSIVQGSPTKMIRAVVDRDGVLVNLDITPALVQSKNGEIGQIGATVQVPEGILEKLTVQYSLDIVPALGAAIEKVTKFSLLTVKMMGKMLVGKASIENLSGPISIAQYAGESAAMGVSYFFKFVAIVSISLGVLNLMPIPMLDGGHLLFFAIEAIKGSPVSETVQLIGQQFGILLLFCLMGLAFFLDIERILM